MAAKMSSQIVVSATTPFPPLYTYTPAAPHTHAYTIVLLHGRGSNGAEFATDLFCAKTSVDLTLPEALPNWRFVFPTSLERWNATFEESENAWFAIASLTDVERDQETQLEGLRESLIFLREVLGDEVARIGGKGERIVLGGISMGMAVGLWLLLGEEGRGIGGFVGFNGWLPFWGSVERIIDKAGDWASAAAEVSRFINDTIESGKAAAEEDEAEPTSLASSVPVFLGHGTDDAYVDISLGQKVAELFRDKLGMNVVAENYKGAESEGHWIKEPEGFDSLVRFLKDLERV